MKIGKSLSLSFNNTAVFLKSLLVQIIAVASTLALAYVLLSDFVTQLYSFLQSVDIGNYVIDCIEQIKNNTLTVDSFTSGLKDFLDKFFVELSEFPTLTGNQFAPYLSVLACLCLYSVCVTIPDVSVGCLINEYMTSNSRRAFVWYFFTTLGKAFVYALLHFVIAIIVDGIGLLAIIALYLLQLALFHSWSVIVPIILLVCYISLRVTALAFWLPSIANERLSVGKALQNALQKIVLAFWSVFWKVLVSLVVCVAVAISLVYYLDNLLAYSISLVFSFVVLFVLKCTFFVEYFEVTGKPYFFKYADVEGTEKYNRVHRIKE